MSPSARTAHITGIVNNVSKIALFMVVSGQVIPTLPVAEPAY
jgi:hypothetical protein